MIRIIIILLLISSTAYGQIINGSAPYRVRDTSTPAPGWAGPLDTFTARAAYSLRQLKASATNAVIIRRSSDDAELSIGFVNHTFDTASFQSFVGGGSGYVKTWYDQTGNGNNLTNTTTSQQPQLVLSKYGLNPALYLQGSPRHLNVTNFMSGTTPSTMIFAGSVYQDPPAATIGHMVAGNTGADHYPYTDGTIYDAWGSSVRKTAGNPSTSLASLHIYCAISAASDWRNYVNNTSLHTTTSNTVQYGSIFSVGRTISGSYANGWMTELYVFDSALSTTDRNNIHASINAKYSVY